MSDLLGEELSGIAFVRDYVELLFDGPILRALADPTVTTRHGVHVFPEVGSRDALCSLIGRAVARADELDDRLSLTFDAGATVEIPRVSPSADPEIAHLIAIDGGRPDIASMRIWENLA